MTKREFLRNLSRALSPLEFSERQKTVSYYREMIDDAMDAGESEEQVIARLGDPGEIAAQILSEAAARGELRRKAKPIPIILIILGSPVWLPLLLALVVVAGVLILTIYVVVWSLIIAAFAVVLGLVLAGLSGLVGFFVLMTRNIASSFFVFGAGMVCAGLAMLLIMPLWTAAKWIIRGTGKVCAGIWHRTTDRFRRVEK